MNKQTSMTIKYGKVAGYSSDGRYTLSLLSEVGTRPIELDLHINEKDLFKRVGNMKEELYSLLSNCWRVTVPVRIDLLRTVSAGKFLRRNYFRITLPLDNVSFIAHELIGLTDL